MTERTAVNGWATANNYCTDTDVRRLTRLAQELFNFLPTSFICEGCDTIFATASPLHQINTTEVDANSFPIGWCAECTSPERLNANANPTTFASNLGSTEVAENHLSVP